MSSRWSTHSTSSPSADALDAPTTTARGRELTLSMVRCWGKWQSPKIDRPILESQDWRRLPCDTGEVNEPDAHADRQERRGSQGRVWGFTSPPSHGKAEVTWRRSDARRVTEAGSVCRLPAVAAHPGEPYAPCATAIAAADVVAPAEEQDLRKTSTTCSAMSGADSMDDARFCGAASGSEQGPISRLRPGAQWPPRGNF